MKLNLPKPFVTSYKPQRYRSAGDIDDVVPDDFTRTIRVTGAPSGTTATIDTVAARTSWNAGVLGVAALPGSRRLRLLAPGGATREATVSVTALGAEIRYASIPLVGGTPAAISLRVYGVPPGAVYALDGRSAAHSTDGGWEVIPTSAGTHALRIFPGSEPPRGGTVTAPGEVQFLDLPELPREEPGALPPPASSVQINNVPAGSRAQIAGHDTEFTLVGGVMTVPAPPGSYALRIQATSEASREGRVRVPSSVDFYSLAEIPREVTPPSPITLRVVGFPEGATATIHGETIVGEWEGGVHTIRVLPVPAAGTYILRVTPTSGAAREGSVTAPSTFAYSSLAEVPTGTGVIDGGFSGAPTPAAISLLIQNIIPGSAVYAGTSGVNLTSDPRSLFTSYTPLTWGVPAERGVTLIRVVPPTGTAKIKNDVAIPATGALTVDYNTMRAEESAPPAPPPPPPPPVAAPPVLRIVGMPRDGVVYVNGVVPPRDGAAWADSAQSALIVNLIPGSYTIRIVSPAGARAKSNVIVPAVGNGEVVYGDMAPEQTQTPAREEPKPGDAPVETPNGNPNTPAKPDESLVALATIMLSMPTPTIQTFRGAIVRAADRSVVPMTSVMQVMDNGSVMYSARVPPGTYTIEANTANSSLTGSVTANAGQIVTVELSSLTPARNGLAVVPPVPEERLVRQAIVIAAPPPTGMSGAKKVMLVGGVALGGWALYEGWKAYEASEAAKK